MISQVRNDGGTTYKTRSPTFTFNYVHLSLRKSCKPKANLTLICQNRSSACSLPHRVFLTWMLLLSFSSTNSPVSWLMMSTQSFWYGRLFPLNTVIGGVEPWKDKNSGSKQHLSPLSRTLSDQSEEKLSRLTSTKLREVPLRIYIEEFYQIHSVL